LRKPRIRARRRAGGLGFTLLEALLGVALSGFVIYALAMIAGQWIPNWRRSFAEVQRTEMLSLGLERMTADLAAAEFVTPNAAAKDVWFEGRGLSVTFVRSALGPNAASRLEVIRLAETADERGFALVRSRAPFAPLGPGRSLSAVNFSDSVVLVRAPFRVSFAYAGPDRVWRDAWVANPRLPTAVRITIRDAASEQVLAASTATLLRVDVPPECALDKSPSRCAEGLNSPAPAPQPARQPSAEQTL